MDTVKVGRFLAELRREKNLTQEKLGEQLGVTNKTISRWENGNYMPPVEVLPLLGEIFGVSINEILSGRRLGDTEFRREAEANLEEALKESAFSLKDKIRYFRRKWEKEHMWSLIVGAFVLVALFAAGIILDNGLRYAAVLLGIVWHILRYNRMMAYVEQRAFDGTGEDKKNKI